MKFRFVDKVLQWKAYDSILGLKAVSYEEYSLKDRFGDQPRLPETLLLESFLQLGNWLILLSSDFNEMGMVVRIDQACFYDSLQPGRQIRMAVTVSRRRDDGFELAGEGRVDGKTVITGLGCLAVPVPAKDYARSEDLRVLFSEIYQPSPAV